MDLLKFFDYEVLAVPDFKDVSICLLLLFRGERALPDYDSDLWGLLFCVLLVIHLCCSDVIYLYYEYLQNRQYRHYFKF